MEETTEQRIARERDDRQRDRSTRDLKRQADSGARPTNHARREDVARRFAELRSPSVPAARPSAPQAVSGKAVDFYTWKAGNVGKIKILTEGDFTEI